MGAPVAATLLRPGVPVRFRIPGWTATQLQWRVLQEPVTGRAAVLGVPGTMDAYANYFGDVSHAPVVGLRMPGRYVFEAVSADNGASGRCAVRVVPPPGLFFLATWSPAPGDGDIVVIRENGAGVFCDSNATAVGPLQVTLSNTCSDGNANACSFRNCGLFTPGRLDWDEITGTTLGDPVLEADMRTGPEWVHLPQPQPGRYLVGFTSPMPLLARVHVYVDGFLLAQLGSLPQPMEYQPLAVLEWSGQTACVAAAGAGGAAHCVALGGCSGVACTQCGLNADCGPGTGCDPDGWCAPVLIHPCGAVGACAAGQCLAVSGECEEFRCACQRGVCHPDAQVCAPPQAGPYLLEGEPDAETSEAHVASLDGLDSLRMDLVLARPDVDAVRYDVPVEGVLAALVTPYMPHVDLWQDGRLRGGQIVGNQWGVMARVQAGAAYARVGSSYWQDDRTSVVTHGIFQPLAACQDEAGEPNDSPSQAVLPVLPPGRHVRALCAGTDAEDWFTLTQPAQTELAVRLDGWLPFLLPPNLTVLDDQGVELLAPSRGARFTVPSVAAQRVVRVGVQRDPMDSAEYFYALSYALGRTDPCEPAGHEPNNDAAAALPLTAPQVRSALCAPQDVDFFLMETAAQADLAVTMTRTSAGTTDRVSLRDATGTTQIAGISLAQTSEGTFVVPALPAGTYLLRVSTSSTLPFPADYLLTVASSALVVP